MQEIWKDCVGFEGKYKVSNLGNVKSLNFRGNMNIEHILKQAIRSKRAPYLYVTLFDFNYKRIKCPVHILVAKAFIPNQNNYPCVNHKDENKHNNCVTNLEWCTYKYNSNYGTAKKRWGDKNKVKINQYSINGEYITTFNSCYEAAIAIGKTYKQSSNISTACKRKGKAFNYYWRKYEDFPNCENLTIGNGVKILKFDLEKNFIKGYRSINEAIKELNITEKTYINLYNGIFKACSKHQSSRNFYWRFINDCEFKFEIK